MKRFWSPLIVGAALAAGVAGAALFYGERAPLLSEEGEDEAAERAAGAVDASLRSLKELPAIPVATSSKPQEARSTAAPSATARPATPRREREKERTIQETAPARNSEEGKKGKSGEVAPAREQRAPALRFPEKECTAYRNSFWLYPEPEAQVLSQERRLRAEDPAKAALLRTIACIPHVTWLVGGDAEALGRKARETVAAAAAADKTPVLVVYHTPDHRRAYWHALAAQEDYPTVIRAIARAVGTYDAWVILEPDALPLAFFYESGERRARLAQLREALALFRQYAPRARVYLDAGHSNWLPAPQVVALLREGGLQSADGVSLNVSNFYSTASQVRYGEEIVALWGGEKTFLIDTSRNGRGAPADRAWCNPPGRAVGVEPTLVQSHPSLDALLWVKPPGESDGTCRGGPSPGKFWLDYALDLVRNRTLGPLYTP